MNCDECAYNAYDEEDEGYYCSVDMDEDDYARLMLGGVKSVCPFFRNGDEWVRRFEHIRRGTASVNERPGNRGRMERGEK